MQRLIITFAFAAMISLTGLAVAQDPGIDDPVPYEEGYRDYLESGNHFGTAVYPRYERRYSSRPRRYDNRSPAGLEYPPVDTRDRYARNYGPPQLDRWRRPSPDEPYYDDPNPFDNPYGRPQNQHYIAPDENNFRGGRYATDYPGFRGGWYGRDHLVRIRAGEYTAGAYANAFWDHQHRVRNTPGEHNWNWISGQGY